MSNPDLPLNRADLERFIRMGITFEFLFFWGHRHSGRAPVSKACFSQWFEAPFVIDDVRYPTAEHYMMAEKARLFGDESALRKILQADSPGAAKAFGREVLGFDERLWVKHRFDIVVRGNRAKFSQSDLLGNFLVSTDNKILVEASPVDRIWGIGLAADDPSAKHPNLWQGENLLGFALMAVRDERLASIKAFQ